MEKLSECPICNSIHLIDFQRVTDYFGTQEEFQVVQCKNCNFLFTNPRPGSREITKYYKSGNYISHGDKGNMLQDFIYRQIQLLNFKYKNRLIRKYIKSRRSSLLDFGCGSGNWLNYMSKKSWNGVGIEPDDQARLRAKTPLLNIYPSTESMPHDSKFQVITAFHVLEHVHNLNDTLVQLIAKLEPNGILMIALPNPLAYDARQYGKYWAGWDIPRHLYHFKPNDVSYLATKVGLKIVNKYPLYWDSFYVSLLSEKYKGNSFSLLRALYQGLKSNVKAYKNDNFSSLIYVLQAT